MGDFRVDQIDHVELFVPDQREAAAWLERVLGMRVVERFRDWSANGPLMVTTHEAGTRLALFRGEPESAGPRAAFRRVAFRVSGAAMLAFLERLDRVEVHAEGGARVTASDLIDHSRSWSIYFVDPWGHRFEITTYDYEHVGAALASDDGPRS